MKNPTPDELGRVAYDAYVTATAIQRDSLDKRPPTWNELISSDEPKNVQTVLAWKFVALSVRNH